MPGCHVIGTPSIWGESSSNTPAVVVTTGKAVFALPMKPGHQYSVKVEIPQVMTGPTATIEIKAYEADGHGMRTRTFSRATSTSDLTSCKEQAKETILAPSPAE